VTGELFGVKFSDLKTLTKKKPVRWGSIEAFLTN
jgi:hypothetical protein